VRYLVPAVIVLILVVGALIAFRMYNRAQHNKRYARVMERRADWAESYLMKISKELNTQTIAGIADLAPLHMLLRDFDDRAEELREETRKEIGR
jgi:hypothetical protein